MRRSRSSALADECIVAAVLTCSLVYSSTLEGGFTDVGADELCYG